MNDYMTNSVQSLTAAFGLNWCRSRLKQALESIYGEGRKDIALLSAMLEDGTVDDIASLDLHDTDHLASWKEEQINAYEEPPELVEWALHTWMTAVRGTSVFEAAASPLPVPVIEAADRTSSGSVLREGNREEPENAEQETEQKQKQPVEDIISLMQQPDTEEAAGAPETETTVDRPARFRRLLLPGAGIAFIAAMAAAVMLLPETPFSEPAFEDGQVQGSMEDSDWMNWLSDVENGAFENELVLPGCETVEKGAPLEEDHRNEAGEITVYPGGDCSRYAENGTIFAAGRDLEEWDPRLEDIEEIIGSPDLLNVDANANEMRALYQRSPHDIFLVFSDINEQEALSYVEIGNIDVSSEDPAALLDYPR
ncbi:hypothetical protein [Salibacterium sp. K-3]